jgi:hypothetical protein
VKRLEGLDAADLGGEPRGCLGFGEAGQGLGAPRLGAFGFGAQVRARVREQVDWQTRAAGALGERRLLLLGTGVGIGELEEAEPGVRHGGQSHAGDPLRA